MFFSRKPEKSSVESSNVTEKLSVLESIYETQAVAEFSPEGMVLSANALYHDLFGCHNESLINRPHKELCHPKDVNSPEYATFWQKLAAGTLVNGQFRRKNADGKTIWLDATYAPIRDTTGQVIKVVKIAHDVTSLMEKNNRVTDAFKAVERSMAVVEFDCNGVIQRANGTFLLRRAIPPVKSSANITECLSPKKMRPNRNMSNSGRIWLRGNSSVTVSVACAKMGKTCGWKHPTPLLSLPKVMSMVSLNSRPTSHPTSRRH